MKWLLFVSTWPFYAGAFVLAGAAYTLYQVVRIAFLSAYRHFRGEEQRSC
jgi:hypothetical protein